jgi:hypothetical protein
MVDLKKREPGWHGPNFITPEKGDKRGFQYVVGEQFLDKIVTERLLDSLAMNLRHVSFLDTIDIAMESARKHLSLGEHSLMTAKSLESAEWLAKAYDSLQPAIMRYAEDQQRIQDISRSICEGLGPYLSKLGSISESTSLVARLSKQFEDTQRIITSLAPPSLDAQTLHAVSAAGSITSFYQFDSIIKQMDAATRGLDLSRVLESLKPISEKIVRLFESPIDQYDLWRSSVAHLTVEADEVLHLLPIRERFLTEDLRGKFGVVVEEIPEDLRENLVQRADEHFVANMPEVLQRLDPALYSLWNGAWESLRSSNPDKIRHTLVSARELVTQVLHKLSPDPEFAAWDTGKQYCDDRGRPTRRGRLMFIYSRIQSDPLRNFINAEINASLQLVDLFQAGTHTVDLPFTDEQLEVILRKVHSTICALVEIRLSS